MFRIKGLESDRGKQFFPSVSNTKNSRKKKRRTNFAFKNDEKDFRL